MFLHHWEKLSITASVFVETSTHTYSLSEEGFEGFGYNYGWLKRSASHASRENTLLRCGKIQKCSRNLLRRFADGWTELIYADGTVLGMSIAVTREAGHMLSEKSQRTQNGTMFVDLDWPLNASRQLSASAELLVLQAGCPSCRPTNSVKPLKGIISHSMDLLTPSSPGGLPTLVSDH